MSQNNVYIDIDDPAPIPILVQLGQTLVLIHLSTCGGRFLHHLDVPASHFAAEPIVNHGLTPLPGQPADTHIVLVGKAIQKGSGNILVQFAPPNPTCQPDAPSSVAFNVS